MIRSCVYTLWISTLFPRDKRVFHSYFFSVVRHADPWQQVRQEVQTIDELWSETARDSMLVVVPQLKQKSTIPFAAHRTRHFHLLLAA
jgi:hypothetical protein